PSHRATTVTAATAGATPSRSRPASARAVNSRVYWLRSEANRSEKYRFPGWSQVADSALSTAYSWIRCGTSSLATAWPTTVSAKPRLSLPDASPDPSPAPLPEPPPAPLPEPPPAPSPDISPAPSPDISPEPEN